MSLSDRKTEMQDVVIIVLIGLCLFSVSAYIIIQGFEDEKVGSFIDAFFVVLLIAIGAAFGKLNLGKTNTPPVPPNP